MQWAMILSRSDSETAYNALRLANHARAQGNTVSVFLLGAGVELEQLERDRFDALAQAEKLVAAGGILAACGSCLKIRQTAESKICPASNMQTLYEMIQAADRVITF